MSKNRNLTFSASLTGIVNNEKIELEGEGRIQNGHTDGKYNLIKIANDFSPSILSSVLVTGYPNASESLNNIENIFVGCSYKYSRLISFENGDVLELKTKCNLDNGHLHSTFELNGVARHPNLKNIEPLVESWNCTGKGKISGHFTASWLNPENNSLITASANSEYILETDKYYKQLLHRFIKIETTFDHKQLRKIQDVVLFDQFPHKIFTNG